ncbi:MAG TPA: hypothetical protein PLS34_03670 [Gammaproteobacteria bacterium]|nr:hypothetical protein [Gammaproteobacteria bacterium]
MAAAPRTRVRLFACVLALAAANGPGAAEPARLAATLVTPEGAAALLDFGAGQAWLRAGESMGGCQMESVATAAAELRCGDRRIRLALEPGLQPAAESVPAPAPEFGQAALPPGMLRALAERPQAIALAADFAPVVEQGRLQGWRVARLDEGGPLAGMGLREADVIHAIDGAPAAEPAAFAAAIRALPGVRAFTLELSRDDRPLTLLVAAPPAP